jgi:hypothetical protein
MRLESALIPVNFRPGRVSSYGVDMIVVHVTEGDIASVKSWFNNPAAQASAHYCVTRDGTIVRFVDEDDTAWHAGRVLTPTAELVKQRLPANPNGYSIGIEHEGTGREELTDAQRASSIWLIRDIAHRRGIPLTRDHVVGHHEIFAAKTCPGAISVDRLVHDAREGLAIDAPPQIVYSPSAKSYLIVTRYVNDNDWSFVPYTAIAGAGTRAGTALSKMPLHP